MEPVVYDQPALPVALAASGEAEPIATAREILRQQDPVPSLHKLPFPTDAFKSGSFLAGVLQQSSETALLALPPKDAALKAILLLSRLQDGDFSARVGTVLIHLRRQAYIEQVEPGPIL